MVKKKRNLETDVETSNGIHSSKKSSNKIEKKEKKEKKHKKDRADK